MLSPPTLAVPDRFAQIMAGLCAAVAARQKLILSLAVLIWTRLSRTGARFTELAARVRAGTLPAPLPPGTRSRPAALSEAPISAWTVDPARPRPPRLPNRFGWLIHVAQGDAACIAGQLRVLLTDPEMQALVAVPQIARLLRPLCRGLAINLREFLPLPPADTPHSGETPDAAGAECAALHPSSRPSPARGRGASFPVVLLSGRADEEGGPLALGGFGEALRGA